MKQGADSPSLVQASWYQVSMKKLVSPDPSISFPFLPAPGSRDKDFPLTSILFPVWTFMVLMGFHMSKKEIKECETTFSLSELSLGFRLSVLLQNPILNN